MDYRPSTTPRLIEVTPYPQRIIVFLALLTLDLSFNAAAGSAAAAAGARRNGPLSASSPPLPTIIALGALTGLLKSSILAIPALADRFGGLSSGMSILLSLLFNPFGICALLVAFVCQHALPDGEIPQELLVAGVVAALPLLAELRRFTALASAGPSTTPFTLWTIGWDALAGYTFARVAQNQGYRVCELEAAAAAGAVYGCISAARDWIVACVGMIRSEVHTSSMHGTRGSWVSLLGRWEVHEPLLLEETRSYSSAVVSPEA